MLQSLDEQYQHLCQNGTLVHNAFQQEAIFLLEEVLQRLIRWRRYPAWIQKAFRKHGPKGIYLYSGAGRGKTTLLDLFFNALPFTAKKKIPFHTFMEEVHTTLKASDINDTTFEKLSCQWRQQAEVLCLDEMAVTHIADAMILQPLFEAFLRKGILLIITSSMPPHDLYPEGLERHQFLPFITFLEKNLSIFSLEGKHNYRNHLALPRYFENTDLLHKAYIQLTGTEKLTRKIINIGPQPLVCTAHHERIGLFSFHEICEKPYTKKEYQRLTLHFDTFFIESVPEITAQMVEPAKQLTLFIDILYDSGCSLYMSASVPLDKLYGGEKPSKAIKRTLAHIQEMTNAGLQ